MEDKFEWLIMGVVYIIGMVFIGIGIAQCQELHVIATNNTDAMTVRWGHDGLDVQGNLDKLISFDLYMKIDNGVFVYKGSTVDSIGCEPAQSYVFSDLIPNARHEFGVTAVDWVGNQSAMHTSVELTAALGGWYLVIDIGPPRKSFRVGP